MKGSILAAIAVLFVGASAQSKEILLTTSNVCVLNGEVNQESMADLKSCIVKKVLKRKRKRYPIYVYLQSGGGSIYAGIRFIQFARTIPNLHTITEFAASMAAGIAQGVNGQRYITDMGVMMFHRARGGFSGQFADGEIEQRLALWKKIVNKLELMQASRIGISLKQYKDKRKDEWWLYGRQAVSEKVADYKVTVRCSSLLMSRSKTVKKRTIFGVYEETINECPLLN